MNMSKALVVALAAVFATLAPADQGSWTNSGGSTSGDAGVSVSSSATSPAGTLSLYCAPTTTGACAGGSFTYASADGVTAIDASFTSGSYAKSCSGGGKGGNVKCSYSFSGAFRGTLTVDGATQAITGITSQAFGTSGGAANGTSAYHSAYAPFYYSDSEQILRSDDLQGTNQIAFGTQGGDVGQFYGAYGIALDPAGRIYVADTYNCRIVRFDDMNGTNWISYGGDCGAGDGQFYDPSGIAVDSSGKIYVMDTGNSRVVRIDDMNGGNWTVLTQSPPVGGISYHSFQDPVAVALDAAGRIYVADAQSIVRVDDMTGANWTSLGTGANSNSLAVDSGGTLFGGGGGARFVVDMTAVLDSSGAIGPVGSYYVFGITPVPLPTPRPSAISFTPPALDFTQNVGSTSPAQTTTLANFGGSLLSVLDISASGGYSATSDCPASLAPGASCAVNVFFTPSASGELDGQLTITDDSGNAGATQIVPFTGVGTAPVAAVTPASLSFSSQVLGSTSSTKNVVLKNIGDGPLQVVSVTASAPFGQTNTCSVLVPGESCSILVTFAPTVVGPASGALTIDDDAGTQTVSLAGTGSAPVAFSPGSLSFGKVTVGNTSAAKTTTLTNKGKVTLSVSNIVASAGFAVSSNTCGAGIAAGATCAVGVTFSPTTIGAVTGTLTFTDDAWTSPQTVALSGTGGAPPAAPGSVPDGATVAGAPLKLQKGAGGTLMFSWSSSCTGAATDYAVYEGTLPIAGAYDHVALGCALGTANTADISPSPGNRYYLVVPETATNDGSYGRDWIGGIAHEIPPAASGCHQQFISSCP